MSGKQRKHLFVLICFYFPTGAFSDILPSLLPKEF